MKQYVIDELRIEEYEKIKAGLDEKFGDSGVGGLYWVPIDEAVLTEVQDAHAECKPFYFALELEEGRLACELLVRTKNRIRCDCIAYAEEYQRNWLIRLVDGIFERLGIHT